MWDIVNNHIVNNQRIRCKYLVRLNIWLCLGRCVDIFCLEKAQYVICEDEKSTSFISYFCYFLNNSCLQWQVINFRLFTRITIYLEPIKAQSWGSSVPVSFITISYDEEVELERFGYLVHNNVSCENCEVFYLLALLRVKLIVEPNWSNINILYVVTCHCKLSQKISILVSILGRSYDINFVICFNDKIMKLMKMFVVSNKSSTELGIISLVVLKCWTPNLFINNITPLPF